MFSLASKCFTYFCQICDSALQSQMNVVSWQGVIGLSWDLENVSHAVNWWENKVSASGIRSCLPQLSTGITPVNLVESLQFYTTVQGIKQGPIRLRSLWKYRLWWCQGNCLLGCSEHAVMAISLASCIPNPLRLRVLQQPMFSCPPLGGYCFAARQWLSFWGILREMREQCSVSQVAIGVNPNPGAATDLGSLGNPV